MRLRTLLASLIFVTLSAPGFEARGGEQSYNSCCVCVRDTSDVEMFISMCKRWLGETSRATGCRYRKVISMDDTRNFNRVSEGARCENLHLYGAFHGNSSKTQVPFQISAQAASAYQAKSVCYDGVTCMVFDNIEDVKACARDVAQNQACKFQITGNQNIGLGTVPFFCIRPREISEATSKLTAVIEEASVRYSYAPCSAQGAICGYLPSKGRWAKTYAKSKNDPNAKWCIQDGLTIEQRCCPDGSQRANPDSMGGFWAAPGHSCR